MTRSGQKLVKPLKGFERFLSKFCQNFLGRALDLIIQMDTILYNQGDTCLRLTYDKQTDNEIVVKSGYTQSRKNQIQNEIRVLRVLSHDNIIKIAGCGSVDDENSQFFIVLPYACGGDLLSYVQKGPIPEELVQKTAQKILNALQYMHGLGIVHRDVKPDNILITGKRYAGDNVVLSDFGLAIEVGGDGYFTDSKGSLEYAAPELLAPGNLKTEKVDIWALGVTLYTCLTGSLPFTRSQENSIAREILSGLPLFRSKKNTFKRDFPLAYDLLKSMLAVDPKERISASDALDHPWFDDLLDD